MIQKQLINKIEYKGVEASLYSIETIEQKWFCGYLGGIKVQSLISLLEEDLKDPENGSFAGLFPLPTTFISEELVGFDTAFKAVSDWKEDEATDCLLAGLVRFLSLYRSWIDEHSVR